MIYSFSGTGNSKYVAAKLSTLLGDNQKTIPTDDIDECDVLGLVFPVYAWGLPTVVEQFIKKLHDVKPKYTWAVITCGDDVGYTDRILSAALQKVGISLSAVFSVQMPNTYVCLPGFDVDPDEIAAKKVASTDSRIPSIVVDINEQKRVVDVVRGSMPYTKTYVLRPLFNATLVTDRYFHTNDKCTQCGLCACQCPLYNITMEEGQVSWHGNCTGCLRCYHQCPRHAIEFSTFTKNKGQKKPLK